MGQLYIMTALLPIELISYIIEYVDDIDVRRHFGVYRRVRIDLPLYRPLPYIIRTPNPNGSTVLVDNYSLPNVSNIPFRREHNIENDMVDVSIDTEPEGAVEVYVGIYRLRPKIGESYQEAETGLNRFFFKGNHHDHYWSYLLFRYTIR